MDRRAAWALLSGLLLTAAFPDIGLEWMAWVALAPLLLAIRDRRPGAAFRLGFMAGFVHYATLVYWVVHTMRTYGHLPLYLAVPALFLLAAYLALYPALFSAALAGTGRHPLAAWAMVPVCWTGLEYLRATLFTGFPWELLGYSQFQRTGLIQIADLAGPYGLSFLLAMGNGTVALLFLWATGWLWRDRAVTRRCAVMSVLIFGTCLAATLIYGHRRMETIDRQAAAAETLRVTAIQGNIPQTVKWDPEHREGTVATYLSLTEEAAEEGSQLAVWPETATPFHFFHHRRFTRMVLEGVRSTGIPLLTGTPYAEREGDDYRFYNSALLIRPDGTAAGRYDKVHLVPYGEYVPLQRWMPFVQKLVQQVGDFEAGEMGQVLAADGYRLGTLICYEIIFPALARSATDSGATLLVNLTNDAWYGRTAAPYQHFSMAVFRAVENRRALVRAANTGISGFIDPVGRVAGTTPLFTTTRTSRAVPLMQTRTVYTARGDRFALGCLVLTAIGIAGAWTGRRKAGAGRSKNNPTVS